MHPEIFRQLPKAELHLHLDCSLSYDVVSRIDPTVTEQAYRDRFVAPAKCRDLADYLLRSPAGYRLMQSEENIRLVVVDLFRQLQAENVIYAELRYAPLQHLEGGLRAEEVVGIVEEQTRRQSREYGIDARNILCTLRHFDESQSLETIKLVQRFRGTVVTGFDIAADEAGFPINPHVAAFRYAADHHIACTAHAGEARGAESVWKTCELLRPKRIGHGVRSIEDPRLLEYLTRERIHLEVCPTSNIQVDVFDAYGDHPADFLYRQGVHMSISTDTRTISSIDLTGEYGRLHEHFGWTSNHFFECNRMALEAAFIDDQTRSRVLARLKSGYTEAG